MAVLRSEDGKVIAVDCSCGCDEGLRIKIKEFDQESYSILTYTSGNFYKEQNFTGWRVFTTKLKKIWRIIRNKDYCYSEIIMTKQDFAEFQKYINDAVTPKE